MCHAAAWLINHESKPPHGKVFKYWAAVAMRAFPRLSIATCHTYDINYKFKYQCQTCRKIYGRHSKSIDCTAKACGTCRGQLKLMPRLLSDGTPAKERQASKWQLFTKAHLARLKAENPGLPHREVMELLSQSYKAEAAGVAV